MGSAQTDLLIMWSVPDAGSAGQDPTRASPVPFPSSAHAWLLQSLRDGDIMMDEDIGNVEEVPWLWLYRSPLLQPLAEELLAALAGVGRAHRAEPSSPAPWSWGSCEGAAPWCPGVAGPGVGSAKRPGEPCSPCRRWMLAYERAALAKKLETYKRDVAELAELTFQEELRVLQHSRVTGMTTTGETGPHPGVHPPGHGWFGTKTERHPLPVPGTSAPGLETRGAVSPPLTLLLPPGAAKYRQLLQHIQPHAGIVEGAAETCTHVY